MHSITDGVDEGPIWYREQVPYKIPVRGSELYERVVDRSWRAFCEQWKILRDADSEPMPQSEIDAGGAFRRKDLLTDQLIDLDTNSAAKDVVLRFLAHDFSPGYSAQVLVGGKIYNATLHLNATEE